MLPTPKVGEHTINQVDKNTDQNNNQSAANIINILLVIATSGPVMSNNLIDNIVHYLLPPFAKTTDNARERSQERQSDQGEKPKPEEIQLKERLQKRNDILNHLIITQPKINQGQKTNYNIEVNISHYKSSFLFFLAARSDPELRSTGARR